MKGAHVNAAASPMTIEIRRLDNEGLGPITIARRLGTSVDRVNQTLRQSSPAVSALATQPPPQRRPCLRCHEPFLSDWIGHRVCDTCKASEESGWSLPAQMIGGSR